MSDATQDPVPPVDLDQPVENPQLVARLGRDDAFSGDDAARETLQLVRAAVYLMAAHVHHPDGGAPVVDGTMRAGTSIELYGVTLPDGRAALALFTDWPSLRAAVPEDGEGGADWKGLVERGEEILKMGFRDDYPGGVVIDPFGPEVSVALDPSQLAWLFANTRAPG